MSLVASWALLLHGSSSGRRGYSPQRLGTNGIDTDYVRLIRSSSRWVVLVMHVNTVALIVLNREEPMLVCMRVVQGRHPFFGNCWPFINKAVMAHTGVVIERRNEVWFSLTRFVYDDDSLWITCILLVQLFRQFFQLLKLFELLQLSQHLLFLFLLRQLLLL